MNENTLLQSVRDQLSEIGTTDRAGTQEHKDLITRYNLIRSQKNTDTNKETLRVIGNFLKMIADYRFNNTSIVLGSNRANRAVIFDSEDLDNFGTCVQIECPIMMDTGTACILLKAPENADFLVNFTSDYAMESPFEFGTWMVNLLTPGIFCHDIAKDMDTNPYSRQEVLGFIPLSEDPVVIMKHMSKLFGGNRELWHMVRGYISMMVHACEKEWMDEKIILPYMAKLFANYNATIDLKGGSKKVSLDKALANVLKNYSVCLRDRTPNDVRAIILIVEKVLPECKFNKKKINGMIHVVEVFLRLLNLHKKNENMTKYVMDVDDYEHYVRYKGGIEGLIAQIFWRDVNGEYRKLKLQIAIDKALNHKKFGVELRKAFIGEIIDDSVLEIALPEPVGLHVKDEKYGKWTPDGISELICTFCGQEFRDTMHKLNHIRSELGQHYYNGHLAVKHAISELGIDASERDLFIKAKKLLYSRYGPKSGFLYTQRCKYRLISFITKFKAL
jgi:hypothetical protein